MSLQPLAVVTGASSGIGAATARRLAADGFRVLCAARRLDRLTALAEEIGGLAVACDVTDDESVARLAEAVGPRLDLLVNNAGGAIGVDPVATAAIDDWRRMYELNVLGTVRVTQALLPALEASGAGTIILTGSTAGHAPYPGGGGYVAAKHAVATTAETLRVELNGRPVRVSEVAPGMVRTEEFSLNRLGSSEAAAAVYAGVAEPLTAEDVADVIGWVATRPHHVNVDLLVVRPLAQANNTTVHRVVEDASADEPC